LVSRSNTRTKSESIGRPRHHRMAVVVFLKGVNVGGHRRLRPSVLAKDLQRFDVVSIGAAGTFVVRKPGANAELRAEFARRVPFEVDAMICSEREILRLIADDPFRGYDVGRDIVAFVGVMATRKRPSSTFKLNLPTDGEWCLKVLARDNRFVLGLYRRQMKAIAYLGQLEKIVGTPLTIRNWNTMTAVGKALQATRA
jgi:uncharacterized protein (DUF1697 family)